ncbi:MAG: 3-hydroxyanthranilate 3,4-dioxygenase [Gammaproteobacteria bacterium]|nr:3-hydroxyanthranilate 3,4-dioxygenase [Gammaproteobacteria bacterium]MCY4219199.1 3-hydroxyanthranilate 3,4-dioxygenase [Gammaproteobacteria bacterium]MCY4274536.1 3-hydroxyanthranilate 3,4-dioxygenase [Gammaproteobacteria bacterium]
MKYNPKYQPFHFQKWIERNRDFLKPPVANKQLFDEDTGMVIMIVGGPNTRVDFHDDPVEEFFYQLQGDMLLKIAESGKIYDVPIREGEVFLLPPHVRHSPQRPVVGSIGLVVEGQRREGDLDGFEWFCFECGEMVHRVELELSDIVKDLPPLFDAFYGSNKDRTCGNCFAIHPGKEPPKGWVSL